MLRRTPIVPNRAPLVLGGLLALRFTNFLPARVRQGADYALFSYYPYQDCPGLSPTWTSDFKLLEQIFPVAKVGFGEIGTSSIYAPDRWPDRWGSSTSP